MSKKTRTFVLIILGMIGGAFAIAQPALLIAGHAEAARIMGIVVMSVVVLIMLAISGMQAWTMSLRDEHFRARDAEMDAMHKTMASEMDRIQTLREDWIRRSPTQDPYTSFTPWRQEGPDMRNIKKGSQT